MKPEFTVAGRITKPVEEVFEAVVNPAHLSAYFTTGGAKGRLVAGTQVSWDFADFPGAFPVDVIAVEPNRRIVLRWQANEGPPDPENLGMSTVQSYQTEVTMEFRSLEDGRTLVTIHESGWHETEGGLKGALGNASGWMHMLCAMKVWLEHGINLREGMFV